MAEDATVALITTANLKTFLGISGSSEDTILDSIVNAASKMIQSFCGKALVQATYTEYYDGSGVEELILKNYPIASVTSLNIDGSRTFGSSTDINVADNVIIDANSGIITLWHNYSVFPKGLRNVKVVYVAGYATNAIPYDLQQACKQTAMMIYKRQYQDQKVGIASETIGDKTTTYELADIPKTAQAIIKRYQKQGSAFVY